MFATPAQGGDYLVKRQNAADVARLAAQPASEPGEHLPPPGPVEIVFDIYPQQTGVKVHGCLPRVYPRPSESPPGTAWWRALPEQLPDSLALSSSLKESILQR